MCVFSFFFFLLLFLIKTYNCLIKSTNLVCMRRNLPRGTKVHFLCLANAGSRFFGKDVYIFNLGRLPDEYANCNVKTFRLTLEIAMISVSQTLHVLSFQFHMVTSLPSLKMPTTCFILCYRPSLNE